MHVAIMNLVNICPKLRQLDHSAFDQKRREMKKIIIIREGPEGENVRYEVRKPPPWCVLKIRCIVFREVDQEPHPHRRSFDPMEETFN